MLLGLIGVRHHELEKVAYSAFLTSIAIPTYIIWFHICVKYYVVGVVIAINAIMYIYLLVSVKILSFARKGKRFDTPASFAII